ncbi:MAG: prepilin-type N-terminal cleavage/methylation domain-containing protein [Acidobacteriota bacterium]|nr:prepilin-type N-terminal cleavage/methylation domain-containing protein [Acidobacteriota bacterium]
MPRQRGFSLVELMIVLVILTIVMGVIFQQIVSLQRRSRAEETKQDIFSEGREFVEQFSRDIHQAGYPSYKAYSAVLIPSDARLAVGIVRATPTDLVIEGDVDGDGLVDSIEYTVCNSAGVCASPGTPNPGGTCPCSLQRSQVVKLGGTNPWAQPTSPSTQVNGLINSAGLGGGGASLLITGQSALPTGVQGAFVAQNDDVLFQGMKNQPVFTYYDVTGTQLAVNTDISGAAGQNVIRSIRTVRIAVNLLGSTADGQTGMKPSAALGAIAKLANCSMYSGGVAGIPAVTGC